jgi:hypothetical protein
MEKGSFGIRNVFLGKVPRKDTLIIGLWQIVLDVFLEVRHLEDTPG